MERTAVPFQSFARLVGSAGKSAIFPESPRIAGCRGMCGTTRFALGTAFAKSSASGKNTKGEENG
jgi:hypothetical protein